MKIRFPFSKNTFEKIVIGLLFGGYVDEGISGTTSLKRENFMKMIEDGKQKKFDLLITKEVSRFSRDTIDSLLYTRKLLEYDVCVYFLSDNIITASSDGELRLTIMSSMAQDEVRKISERTKFGFKRALEKGTVLGTNNIWGYQKNKGKLVIDEAQASLIKEIFDTYANDSKIGLKKLSMLLQEQGYCNHNGNAIHQNTLKKIIQNPKYKGYYTGGLSTVVDYRSKKRNFNEPTEWKIYKDYDKVPPIVSEELWEKANQKLANRSKSASMYQKKQTLYSLSGKLYCEKHKCGFVRKIRHYKNKPDVIYWYCGDFHKTGKKDCMSAYFEEKDLYAILLTVFKKYEIYKEEICQELMNFYTELSKQKNNQEQEIKWQNEIHILESKKNKLLDLALDGIFSKDDLKVKKLDLEKQIEQIQGKLKELQDKKIKHKTQKQEYQKVKENILQELEISEENLEDYIEGLLDKIIVQENQDNNDEKKLDNQGKEFQNNSKTESQVQLKIILSGNTIINYGIPTKLRQISHLKQSKGTDYKKVPLCHSHAHGNHLFSTTTCLFKKSIHVKSNTW